MNQTIVDIMCSYGSMSRVALFLYPFSNKIEIRENKEMFDITPKYPSDMDNLYYSASSRNLVNDREFAEIRKMTDQDTILIDFFNDDPCIIQECAREGDRHEVFWSIKDMGWEANSIVFTFRMFSNDRLVYSIDLRSVAHSVMAISYKEDRFT